LIYVIFDLTMSKMVWLHLHRHSTLSGVPGDVSYETLFTTHQTFAKLVTQIFLSAIKLQKHNYLVTIISTSYWKPFEWFQKIQTYVSSSKYPHIYLSHFEDRQNPLLAITFIGLHQNVWSPISSLLVPYGLWTVFRSLHFSEESCKRQMIQNQMTSKSIIMEFLHAGFSNVTKCSATHVWYSL